MAIWRKYIPIEGAENKFLKCELNYNLGGMNLYNYKNEPRGYYLSVTPVEKSVTDGVVMESFVAFSGIKKCLVEVKRRSKSKEAVALDMIEEHLDELIADVMAKNELIA